MLFLTYPNAKFLKIKLANYLGVSQQILEKFLSEKNISIDELAYYLGTDPIYLENEVNFLNNQIEPFMSYKKLLGMPKNIVKKLASTGLSAGKKVKNNLKYITEEITDDIGDVGKDLSIGSIAMAKLASKKLKKVADVGLSGIDTIQEGLSKGITKISEGLSIFEKAGEIIKNVLFNPKIEGGIELLATMIVDPKNGNMILGLLVSSPFLKKLVQFILVLIEKHGTVLLETQLNIALSTVGCPAICGTLLIMVIKYIVKIGVKRIKRKVYILSQVYIASKDPNKFIQMLFADPSANKILPSMKKIFISKKIHRKGKLFLDILNSPLVSKRRPLIRKIIAIVPLGVLNSIPNKNFSKLRKFIKKELRHKSEILFRNDIADNSFFTDSNFGDSDEEVPEEESKDEEWLDEDDVDDEEYDPEEEEYLDENDNDIPPYFTRSEFEEEESIESDTGGNILDKLKLSKVQLKQIETLSKNYDKNLKKTMEKDPELKKYLKNIEVTKKYNDFTKKHPNMSSIDKERFIRKTEVELKKKNYSPTKKTNNLPKCQFNIFDNKIFVEPLNSNLIHLYSDVNFNQCRLDCCDNDNCTHFTWTNQQCKLMTNKPSLCKIPKENTMSGIKVQLKSLPKTRLPLINTTPPTDCPRKTPPPKFKPPKVCKPKIIPTSPPEEEEEIIHKSTPEEEEEIISKPPKKIKICKKKKKKFSQMSPCDPLVEEEVSTYKPKGRIQLKCNNKKSKIKSYLEGDNINLENINCIDKNKFLSMNDDLEKENLTPLPVYSNVIDTIPNLRKDMNLIENFTDYSNNSSIITYLVLALVILVILYLVV